MKNLVLMTFISLFFSSFIAAQEISGDEAKNIAKSWIEPIITKNNDKKVVKIKDIKEKHLNDKISYSVINFNEGGYVIVGGENGLNPIIAYNKNDYFDESLLTQDEKNWLSFVELIIGNFRKKKELDSNYIVDNNDKGVPKLKSINTPTSVPSLFESLHTSRWAGWFPYSIEMPYQNGSNSCVPVALAQIMKYYRFLLQGSGSNSYTWYDISTPVTLSANFGEEFYNYDNMPFRLTYCGNGEENCDEGSFDIIPGVTTGQMEEISKLIYHCGIAVEMDWRGQDTTGGGTYGTPGNWAQAMENYFNYSDSWTYLNETYISNNHEAFKASIRDELSNGRPVLFNYFDQNWGHGHALVVDGYENDEFFHFAFGRGGFSDTYYYLFSSDDDGLHDELPYTAYYRAAIGIEPNCVSTLNLNNITVSTSSIKAYSATNVINFSSPGEYYIIDGNGTNGGKVIAQAGSSIILNVGFEIRKGGTFEISIHECGSP